MVQVEKLVPEVYRQSRDFQTFLHLWSLIVNTTKYDIDNWLSLYDPLTCKAELLPILAEHIGYEYNYSRSIVENRAIIRTFGKLIRNRGSEVGIKLAMALSLNSTISELSQMTETEALNTLFANLNQLSMVEVTCNYETGVIRVTYPNDYAYVFENNNFGKLIDIVRPVGMYVEIIKSDMVMIGDGSAKAVDISARVRAKSVPFNKEVRATVDKSEINFSEIVED